MNRFEAVGIADCVAGGGRVAYVCTSDETRDALRLLEDELGFRDCKIVRAHGCERIDDLSSSGVVRFVHSERGMRGLTVDYVVVSARKGPELGYEFMQSAAICMNGRDGEVVHGS